MTPEQRIHELTVRQIYYGSSMVVKLNAVNGKWQYKVYAWLDNTKILVTEGKYNGEDPVDLIQVAIFTLGLKKIKVGVPVPDVHSWGLAK